MGMISVTAKQLPFKLASSVWEGKGELGCGVMSGWWAYSPQAMGVIRYTEYVDGEGNQRAHLGETQISRTALLSTTTGPLDWRCEFAGVQMPRLEVSETGVEWNGVTWSGIERGDYDNGKLYSSWGGLVGAENPPEQLLGSRGCVTSVAQCPLTATTQRAFAFAYNLCARHVPQIALGSSHIYKRA